MTDTRRKLLIEAAVLLLGGLMIGGIWKAVAANFPGPVVYVDKSVQPGRTKHLEKLVGFGVIEYWEWQDDVLRLHVGENFIISPKHVRDQILSDVSQWAWCEMENCDGVEVLRNGKRIATVGIRGLFRAKE